MNKVPVSVNRSLHGYVPIATGISEDRDWHGLYSKVIIEKYLISVNMKNLVDLNKDQQQKMIPCEVYLLKTEINGER